MIFLDIIENTFVEAASSDSNNLQFWLTFLGPIFGVLIASFFAWWNLRSSQKLEVKLTKLNRKTQFELSMLEKRFEVAKECIVTIEKIKNTDLSKIDSSLDLQKFRTENFLYLPKSVRAILNKEIFEEASYKKAVEEFKDAKNNNDFINYMRSQQNLIQGHSTLGSELIEAFSKYFDDAFWSEIENLDES